MSGDPVAELNDKIRDLYSLQHFLMSHPELKVDFFIAGDEAHLSVPYVYVDGVRDYDQVDVEAVAAIVRVLKDGGTVAKSTPWSAAMRYTRVVGKRSCVHLTIDRAAVCTPTVVGTEVVVTAAQAERREVREIVEWDCHSVFAAAEEA